LRVGRPAGAQDRHIGKVDKFAVPADEGERARMADVDSEDAPHDFLPIHPTTATCAPRKYEGLFRQAMVMKNRFSAARLVTQRPPTRLAGNLPFSSR